MPPGVPLAVASRSPTRCFFFLLQQLLKNEGPPLDLRSNNPTTQKTQEAQHPEGARHATTQPQKPLHPPVPNSSQPKPLRAAILTQADALRSSSRCCGGSQRRADWANGAGHTKSSNQRVTFPAYRGPLTLPPLQRAWDSKARPIPDLQGSLAPQAEGGSFSPTSGHLDPYPTNGGVAPHRLPAELKGSRTQTLITGGATTPTEPQSSVSPPAAGTTLSSQAAGWHGQRPPSGSQPQLQGGRKPNLTSLSPSL